MPYKGCVISIKYLKYKKTIVYNSKEFSVCRKTLFSLNKNLKIYLKNEEM